MKNYLLHFPNGADYFMTLSETIEKPNFILCFRFNLIISLIMLTNGVKKLESFYIVNTIYLTKNSVINSIKI